VPRYVCPTPTKPGHAKLDSAAHTVGKTRDQLRQYAREPTASEKARLYKAGAIRTLRSRSQGKGQPSSQ